jgi:hypothetical protein
MHDSRAGVKGLMAMTGSLVTKVGPSDEEWLPVFVDVGQLVENPQRVHGGTFNSLVRLRPLKEVRIIQ